jgi:hypothetical protein
LNLIRAEQRRIRRENEAMEHAECDTKDGELWTAIRPVIDQALTRLKSSDRDAVVLRFFRGCSLREVGKTLGVSEDAARMRVDRALVRLRPQLKALGVDSALSALPVALLFASLTGAPVGFAGMLSGSVLTATGVGGGAGFVLSLMNMTKVKAVLTGAAIVAGVATPIFLKSRLDNAQLKYQENLANANDRVAALLASSGDLEIKNDSQRNRIARLEKQQNELLRLRGDVTRLRQENQSLADQVLASAADEQAAERENEVLVEPLTTFTGSVQASLLPGESLITGGWPIKSGRRGVLMVTPKVVESENGNQVLIRTSIVESSEEGMVGLGLSGLPDGITEISSGEIYDSESVRDILAKQVEGGGVSIVSSPSVMALDGQAASVFTGQTVEIDGEFHQVGPSIELVSTIMEDGTSVNLEVNTEWVRANLPETETVPLIELPREDPSVQAGLKR